MTNRTIGLTNGFLVLLLWGTIGMFSATKWWGALPVIFFVLVPVSALVSYRTSVLAKLLLEGKATLMLYATDGFKWAFIAASIFWLWSISSQVMAAGGPLLGASLWQIVKYVFVVAVPVSILVGLIGSAHGALFYYLNRWQITANKSSKKDALKRASS